MPTHRPQSLTRRLSTLAGVALLLVGGCEGSKGPTGIVPGMAVGKFCHQLTHNGQPTTLTLEVGDKTNFTRFVAVTGTCQPTVNLPCTAVPVGLLELRIKEGDVLLTTRQVILHDGEEYLFEPGINASDGSLGIGGGPLLKGRCSSLEFVFPDGGAGDGGVSDGGGGDGGGDATTGDGGAGDTGAPDAISAPDAAAIDAGDDAPAIGDAPAASDGPATVDVAADLATADGATD